MLFVLCVSVRRSSKWPSAAYAVTRWSCHLFTSYVNIPITNSELPSVVKLPSVLCNLKSVPGYRQLYNFKTWIEHAVFRYQLSLPGGFVYYGPVCYCVTVFTVCCCVLWASVLQWERYFRSKTLVLHGLLWKWYCTGYCGNVMCCVLVGHNQIMFGYAPDV